jgi:hypothetical protein
MPEMIVFLRIKDTKSALGAMLHFWCGPLPQSGIEKLNNTTHMKNSNSI